MALPPEIHTYHCLCNTLLLASTHALSSLPRRKTPTTTSSSSNDGGGAEGGGGGEDAALILPLPLAPPELSSSFSHGDSSSNSDSEDGNEEKTTAKETREKSAQAQTPTLPPSGYTILLSLLPDRKTIIIRRDDGFEKRILYRCARCRLVVGYEILSPASASASGGGDPMDVDANVDGDGKGKGKEEGEEDAYTGKVIYLLPGGIMSTGVMARGGLLSDGGGGAKKKKKKIGEEMVDLDGSAVAVFE